MDGLSVHAVAWAALLLVGAALLGACAGFLANRVAEGVVRKVRRQEEATRFMRARPVEARPAKGQLSAARPAMLQPAAARPAAGCPTTPRPAAARATSGRSALACPMAARTVAACLLGAAYFASVVGVYGLGVHAFALCVLGGILLSLSLVDLDVRLIPNGFVLAGVAVWAATFAFWDVGVGVGAFGGWLAAGWAAVLDPGGLAAGASAVASGDGFAAAALGGGFAAAPANATWLTTLVDGLAGALVVPGVALALSFAVDAATGRPSLGGGDVKLLFVVGLFLGGVASAFNLMVACGMGVVFWLATHRACVRAAAEAAEGVEGTEGVEVAETCPVPKPCNATASQDAASAAEANEAVRSRRTAPDAPALPAAETCAGEPCCDSHAFPFGPSIALATWFTLVAGPSALAWLFGPL